MNIRIMRSSVWDDEANTLSYSSQDPEYPATNTRQRWPGRTWHTQDGYVSDQWLKLDNDTGLVWQALIIAGHNFTAGATLKIQTSDDNFATIADDVSIPITDDVIVYFNPTPVTRNYARISITDAANADNYLAIGRVFLGQYLDPRWGFSPEWERTPEDNSVVGESEMGQAAAMQRAQYQRITYEFQAVSVADQAEFNAHFVEYGKARSWWLCEYPANSGEYLRTLYVRTTDWSWKPVAYPIRALDLGVQTEPWTVNDIPATLPPS